MYLDPSFGGMLFQVIFAIVAAGGAIVFAFRRKIRGWFKKDEAPKKRVINAANKTNNDDMVDTLSDEV